MAAGLIPALAGYGLPTQIAVATQPPSDVVQQGVFGTIIDVEDQFGQLDPTYDGTATLSLARRPAGVSFTPMTVSVSGGVAVFDGLSLLKLSAGKDYTFKISTTLPGVGLQTTTTDPVDVSTAATSGVGVFYPLPVDSSLANDVSAADSNADATNILDLVYATAYPVSAGQILFDNSSRLSTKTISIVGDFSDSPVSTGPVVSDPIATITGVESRIFEVKSTSGNLNVAMQGFDIAGGDATDDGGLALAGNPAVSGALLIMGGNVTLSNVTLSGNVAGGVDGASGANGLRDGQNGLANGTNGGNAAGGASSCIRVSLRSRMTSCWAIARKAAAAEMAAMERQVLRSPVGGPSSTLPKRAAMAAKAAMGARRSAEVFTYLAARSRWPATPSARTRLSRTWR